MRNLALIGLILMGAFLGACSRTPVVPTPPSVTPSATSQFRPYTGNLPRPTLPPTWTPTFTPSPAPPTSTATRTPFPSPAPTLSAVEICDAFQVSYRFTDGAWFAPNDAIEMLLGTLTPGVTVRFLARHRLSGENLGVELPSGEIYGMQLPLARLPRPGLYDWTVSVVSPDHGEICARGGYFTLGRTPDATPDITTEATEPTE